MRSRTLITGCLVSGLVLVASPASAATVTETATTSVQSSTTSAVTTASPRRRTTATALRVARRTNRVIRPASQLAAPAPVTTTPVTTTPVTAPVDATVPVVSPVEVAPVAPVVAAVPVGPSGAAMPTGDLAGWRQVMAEDFTGAALPTGWGSYQGQPGGEPNGNWLQSHTQVGSSMLTLAGYQEAGKFTTGGVMASGAAIGRLTYGKYEVRFRMDKGHGVKYAALLWPAAENWPVGGEIDFAEDGGGTRDHTTATLHYSAANTQIARDLPGDFSQWNTLGVEWSPNKLVYTLNGKEWATVTGSMVPTTAMNLAIQSQAGTCGSYAGATCPDSTTPARVDMQVDWAVAYAYAP